MKKSNNLVSVLIIDPSIDTQRTYVSLFNYCGISEIELSDGSDFSVLENSECRVVFIDYNIWTTNKNIQKIIKTKQQKIIFTSTNKNYPKEQYDLFVQKPINIGLLKQNLSNLLF